MRTIIFLFACLFSINISAQQGVKTETIIVKGNCDDCKERIENAADIKGVKVCKWNPDTKVAEITYDQSKVTMQKIKESIASKGYTAGDVAGNQAQYKKLPKCCQYNDGVCEDKKK